MAVLGAQAGLEVDEVVDLDGVAEVLAAQAGRGGDDCEQLVVGDAQDVEGVVGGGRCPGEDGVGEIVEVGGSCGLLARGVERCST